jgi:DNA-directed RNA polymerase specialized sigma24 family protein
VSVVELDEHLFRHEAGRMVAALTRLFGLHNLALVEDVVMDAFCRAREVWKTRGVPDNPSAWLITTARNRALDVVRRERRARKFAPEMGRLLDTEWTAAPAVEEAFAAGTIRDEQLRMMFSCCAPQLPEATQLALILNIMCGFGAAEIAGAVAGRRAQPRHRRRPARRGRAGLDALADRRPRAAGALPVLPGGAGRDGAAPRRPPGGGAALRGGPGAGAQRGRAARRREAPVPLRPDRALVAP